MDYPKSWVVFYHHGYISTILLKNPNMRGGFELIARHNPQVVGIFTPGGWDFQPACRIRMVMVSQNMICTLSGTFEDLVFHIY